MIGTVVKVNNGGFEKPGGGYMHGISCISIVDDDDEAKNMVVMAMETKKKKKKITEEENGWCTYNSSSASSSIGKNSDVCGNSRDDSDDTEEEVESSYKSPLDAMEALEQVLPIRRGISRYYKGRSKSFASLADAASVKDLAKPENAYAKRRRNLLACSLSWDKDRNFPLRSNNGGISKRVTNSNRTTLALAVAMNNSASDSSEIGTTHLLSRFHPRFKDLSSTGFSSPRGKFSAWRSFSMADIQECNSRVPDTAFASQVEAKPA